MTVTKAGGDQIHMVPRFSKVGGMRPMGPIWWLHLCTNMHLCTHTHTTSHGLFPGKPESAWFYSFTCSKREFWR